MRPELKPHASLTRKEVGLCVLTGSETDLFLPNGDPIWAPYLLDMIDAGWVGDGYEYTEAFYVANPHIRRAI